MRRGLALLSATAALTVVTGSPAPAQEQAEVRLILTKQTSFATPDMPLRIAVAAENSGDAALPDLTLTVAVYSPVRSRSEYEQALDVGPVSALVARTARIPGQVAPGGTRRFPTMTFKLPDLTGLNENALYPVTVELRSRNEAVAVLRTVLVFIVEEPLTPLLVSTTFVLDAPVRIRTDGTFVDDALEQQVVEGGRLDSIISALEAVPGLPVTMVVSPVLLEQLATMRDGYRVVEGSGIREVPAEQGTALAAGRLLDRIRELLRQPLVEVVALPYASPSVPALVHAGLNIDLARQVRRGREAVAALGGKEPSRTIFHPPGSAVTASSLAPLNLALAAEPGPTPALLLDGNVVPPPPSDLTPPARIQVEADGTSHPAIATDPGVEARTAALPDDPILRAQWVLGELSAIYFEQPSIPRGAALIFGEQDEPEAGFLQSLLRGIRGAPEIFWLKAAPASRLLLDQPVPDRRRLTETVRPSPLAGSFTTEMSDSRDAVDALDSMADQNDLVGQLDRLLLLSESRYLGGHEDLRFDYLDAARATVDAEFDKVHLPPSSDITLTSRTGRIPVTLRSDAGYPVQLQLSLRATGLELIGGSSRDILLSRPIQTFVFPARAQRTGRFPVQVRLGTPDGTPIGRTEIVVRSTAYNRIALVITIGAALFLALWWGRRFLSRTTR
jgi:Family of unknown function (DUF6049)